jgi:hypothetical protein
MPGGPSGLTSVSLALAATEKKMEELQQEGSKFHRRRIVGIEKCITRVPEMNQAQLDILKNWEYTAQVR